MARSRSSVITRIFVEHGFNPGRVKDSPDEWNRSGYWENKDLKKLAREGRPNPYRAILQGQDPRLYLDVSNVLPREPWVQKVDAFCWPSFSDCQVIKLKRDKASILRSCLKTPFMNRQGHSKGEWMRIIDAHYQEMESIDGLWVDTDKLVTGDHRELKAAMEACGVEYNPEITGRLIG